MAFYEENEGGNGGKFLRVNGQLGVILAKSDEPVDGYEEYTTKNPSTDKDVTYYIKKYKGGVEGKVVGLERVEIPEHKIFGWNLHMEDEDGAFSISFADDRTTTERLLKTYENIDLNEDLHVKVFQDDDGRAAISFRQNGKKVEQKWVGGKDGNLPQPKKSKGKWDYSNVSEFLYDNAMKNIPLYTRPAKEEKADAAAAGAEEAPVVAQGETDDIPF
jgi:hypothetical protein